MSQNDPPYKIVLSPVMAQIMAERRADQNARLAAQGLPPIETESPFISTDEYEAEEKAREKQRGAQKPQPFPKPTSNRLTAAAKAKITARSQSIPGFERHSRKCQICRNPEVDAIEQVYLDWYNVRHIASYFQFDDADVIYRHARATGLDVLRRQNVRIVVERFIEQGHYIKVTVPGILRSIRALSCLDEKGRWTELPSTHILLSGKDLPPGSHADAASISASGVPKNGPTSSTEARPAEQNVAEVEGSLALTQEGPLATGAEDALIE
ncbi:MAG: hypothetical protein ACRD4A_12490 [Candidatus Acidiferrales bacterium]